MGDFGCGLGESQTFFERLGIPGYWRDAHGTAIGVSSIGLTAIGSNPLPELPSIGLVLITGSKMLEEVDERLFIVSWRGHQPFRNCHRENRVVGVTHAHQHFLEIPGCHTLHFRFVFFLFVFGAQDITTDTTDDAFQRKVIGQRRRDGCDADTSIRFSVETECLTQPIDVSIIEQINTDVGKRAAGTLLTGLFCFDPFLPFGNPWSGLLVLEIKLSDFANLEAMVDITGFDTDWQRPIPIVRMLRADS